MIVIKELKKMVLDLCLLICNIDLIINNQLLCKVGKGQYFYDDLIDFEKNI